MLRLSPLGAPSPHRGHPRRPSDFWFLALLATGVLWSSTVFQATAAPPDTRILGFVDVLSGPEREAGLGRLAATEEAVNRYRLYHPDLAIDVRPVDIRAGNALAQLSQADVVVAGQRWHLDALVAAGDVVLAGEVVAFEPASPAGLLDTVTAFVTGSAGVEVTGHGIDHLLANELVPVRIVGVDPLVAQPGETVTVTLENGGFQRTGLARVSFGGRAGYFVEPLVDIFSFVLGGFKVQVPADAGSGPVTLEVGSIGSPAVQRLLVSPVELVVQGEAAVTSGAATSTSADAGQTSRESSLMGSIPTGPTLRAVQAGAALNAPQPCDITFRRLGSPNFFSETADTKDVVAADFENDGRLDVYVPETFLQFPPPDDIEYKNLGNDASGLPNFATITGGLFTNDPAPGNKRQYGADAADIDGDGDIDIIPSGASTQTTQERVRILINNGNLTFTNQAQTRISNFADITTASHSWDEVDIEDMDGDNDLDVLITNRTGGARSAVLRNNGGGFFTAFPNAFGEPTGEVHHDGKWCDVNNDGFPDVAFSQDIRSSQRPLRLQINDANASPPSFTDVTGTAFDSNPAAHTEHVGCADFNRDGRLDLHAGVWRSTIASTPQDFIWLNASIDSNANGKIDASEVSFTRVLNPDPTSAAGEGFRAQVYAAEYGDFNGDGWVDIILSGLTSPKGPFLMCNTANGTFANASPTSGYWRDLSNTGFDHFVPTGLDVGDFNRDGRLDIVFGLGDGLNVASDEPNRIFTQNPPPTGGGGGGGCLQSFQEAILKEPCIAVDLTQADSFELASISEGDFVISPLAGLCRNAMDCPACGTPFLPCERFYNVVFDFAAAGLDPRAADLALYDFAGKLLAVGRNRGDQKIVSFRPERNFRQGGLDQEVYVALEARQSASNVAIPVRLEISDRPIVP